MAAWDLPTWGPGTKMDKGPTNLNAESQILNDEGSDYDRLFYPYLFDGGSANVEDVLAEVRQSTLEKCREVVGLRMSLLENSIDRIVEAGTALAHAFARGGTLFAFGNGGSTTDAQDLVADLTCPPFEGCKALPAITLTSDIAVITAVANDVGFENIFARQVIALGRPGDIAFGISTSGGSANVLAALRQAKRQEMLTVALVGYNGGKMAQDPSIDFCLVTPGDHIPRIQEAQATMYHSLLEVVWAILMSPEEA
jgi:D-sedoheptulose 7-phosphate isomerase